MTLSRKEVENIANLARLELTDEQLTLYQEQLSAVLEYVARLDELDLEGVEPTARPIGMENVYREDIIEPSLSNEEALFNAAANANNQFLIQAVLDE